MQRTGYRGWFDSPALPSQAQVVTLVWTAMIGLVSKKESHANQSAHKSRIAGLFVRGTCPQPETSRPAARFSGLFHGTVGHSPHTLASAHAAGGHHEQVS